MLAPWKKGYDQPRELIKKQRHYFVTKVRLVKAMVFPVVMYGCESWTTKKAQCARIDAFELWCTEQLHFHFLLSRIGGGNGNSLQCSCLENPMDRGAWQAVVHGVTKESDTAGD